MPANKSRSTRGGWLAVAACAEGAREGLAEQRLDEELDEELAVSERLREP